jgi:sirohydrochlorin ferrochelatase
MEATIFIGHGSRTPKGNQQFIEFIEGILEKIDTPIKGYGFLEKAVPSIIQAVEAAVVAGADEVIVIPVLLLPGVHANLDIPAELLRLEERYPSVTIRYGAPIGLDEIMIEILQDRLKAKGHTNEDVLLVGHGSRDPKAANQFNKLANMLEKKLLIKVEKAFIITAPYYSDILANCRQKKYIVPFLLFSGGYMKQLKENVGTHFLCEPVGFDQRIQDILLKRIQQTKVI